MKKTLTKLTLALALAAAAVSLGARPVQAVCGGGFSCPDVWRPVICSNGQVYSNSCYASAACATGCVPYADAS